MRRLGNPSRRSRRGPPLLDWMIALLVLISGCMAIHRGETENDHGATSPADFMTPRIISVSGTQVGDRSSYAPSVSNDANVVAFYTRATNLVAHVGDSRCPPAHPRLTSEPVCPHILAWERNTGDLYRVSIPESGEPPNNDSQAPRISADGTRIVFKSYASNLVAGDTNDVPDTFVRDLTTQTTRRLSVANDGSQADAPGGKPSISFDGSLAIFDSWSNVLDDNHGNPAGPDTFLYSFQTETLTVVSRGLEGEPLDGKSYWVSGQNAISRDGRYVLFESTASNAVPPDDNACPYRTDDPGDNHGPTCIDVYRRDLVLGTNERVAQSIHGGAPNHGAWSAGMSEDGTVVAFSSDSSDIIAEDTNDAKDVFVLDFTTGQTTLISKAWDGRPLSSPSIAPQVSADGTRILFITASAATPDDEGGFKDAFLVDRLDGQITKVSRSASGGPLNDDVRDARLSPDGHWVAFSTAASNLDDRDDNQARDVFLVYVP